MNRLKLALLSLLLAAVFCAPAQAATFNEKVTVNWGVQPLLVTDGAGHNLFSVEKGAAAGANFGSVYVPGGDILNVRNVQGGTATDPNLDLGAGSTAIPGDLGFNYDVGDGSKFYNGAAALMLSIADGSPDAIKAWKDIYTQNGAKIVLDAGQPNYTVTLRHLSPTAGYGTEQMLASDSVVVSGKGFGGNYQAGAPPCAVNGKVPWYDVGGKRVGWVPIATGC